MAPAGKISPDWLSGKRKFEPRLRTASHDTERPSLRAVCKRLANRAWSSRIASRLAIVVRAGQPNARIFAINSAGSTGLVM